MKKVAILLILAAVIWWPEQEKHQNNVAKSRVSRIDAPVARVAATSEDLETTYIEAFKKKVILTPGVVRVDAPAAWQQGITGKGVRVCIVDTGVDRSHPDLKGVVVASKNFSKSGNPEGDDDYDHGTHVAGIIAGQPRDNSVVGVAPGVKIISAKVCDEHGSCEDDDLATAIGWCVEQGAKIINLSLVNQDDHAGTASAIKNAQQKGVFICASAGNDGNAINYPAKHSGVFAWGALGTYYKDGKEDPNRRFDADEVAMFSSHGPEIFGATPGVNVLSAQMGGGHVKFSGTSMASPHGVGVIALLLEKYPKLTQAEVEEVLKQTSSRIGQDYTRDEFVGWGVPQAGAALTKLGRLVRK